MILYETSADTSHKAFIWHFCHSFEKKKTKLYFVLFSNSLAKSSLASINFALILYFT